MTVIKLQALTAATFAFAASALLFFVAVVSAGAAGSHESTASPPSAERLLRAAELP